jgi:O-methyltransferase involved in polyketide biosynthesis
MLDRPPPGWTVVSLGEGLETQVQRVDNGRIHWLSVDLPDAICLRERFLPPTDRFRHIAASALDPAWLDAVGSSSSVFIVAQGLLMYLQPEMPEKLFTTIACRFPTAEIVFDVMPRWFSRLTMKGLNQTLRYRLPPMPWGINRDEINATLHRWIPRLASVTFLDYCTPRRLPHMAAKLISHMPYFRHAVPTLEHVSLATQAPASIVIPFRKTLMTTFKGVINATARIRRQQRDRNRRRPDHRQARRPIGAKISLTRRESV